MKRFRTAAAMAKRQGKDEVKAEFFRKISKDG